MTTDSALQKVLGFGSKEFIEKAIEGGWLFYGDKLVWDDEYGQWNVSNGDGGYWALIVPEILLDPAAWAAVGKVEGWKKYSCSDCYIKQSDAFPQSDTDECRICSSERDRAEMETYKVMMHRFIDALCENITPNN